NRDGDDSGDGDSSNPVISSDGRFVAFASDASNLDDALTPDTNDSRDIYARDLQIGTTTLVSVNRDGTGSGDGSSRFQVISADGRFVAFTSNASDLDDAGTLDTNDFQDVFVSTIPTVVQGRSVYRFIIGLDPGDFSTPGRQGALENKVNEVLANIQAGDLINICEAIDKLTNDILPKTDGETPPPDWVTDPIAQEIEEQIIALIAALQVEATTLGGCP
ncbi:MAG: hypothetical protein V3U60_11850, partial [Gammaproteobacteria bacterium]